MLNIKSIAMKHIIWVLFLCPFLLAAQNCSITYDVVLETSFAKGVLVYTPQDTSFYYELEEEDTSQQEGKGIEETEETEEGHKVIKISLDKSARNYKKYQVYLPKSDSLFNIDYLRGKKVLSYEASKPMLWEIDSVTRLISGYECQKATTFFRGRKYIAWFAAALPVNVGPWKFTNLPGAILQVYDESKAFSWTASSLSFQQNEEELPIEAGMEKMSLEQFTEESDKATMEEVNSAILRYIPKGARILQKKQIRSGRETKFEWESEEKGE